MKILGIAVASWLSGMGAYLGALHVVWGQRMSLGDLRAVVFWSAFAAVTTTVVVFSPVMFGLRKCRLGTAHTELRTRNVPGAMRDNSFGEETHLVHA